MIVAVGQPGFIYNGAIDIGDDGQVVALGPVGVIDGRLDTISEFHAAHHGDHDGRVSAGFGPHSLFDLSPGQVVEIVERADAVDALVHIHLDETRTIHLDETRTARDLVIEKWGGRTTAQILADIGALVAMRAAGITVGAW